MRNLCSVLVLALVSVGVAADKTEGKKVLTGTMKGIDGKDVNLSDFKGKVVLFVNVASKCGKTPQYTGLQKLYEKHGKEGFVIVGVPCNQFGAQEKGSDSEIAAFCSTKYKVTFPMLSKVEVNGEGACPLYKELTALKKNPKGEAKIDWNFTKFLVNKQGEVVSRFEPSVEPEKMEAAIEAELKK